MNILLADDEELARARLRALLYELGGSEIVAEAENGRQALEMVRALMPDVVLMDIGMPGINGMETVRRFSDLPRPPIVIFTTAYQEYALEAFEHQAADYLLKPVRKDRLQQALQRARQLLAPPQQESAASQARSHISVAAHGRIRLVPVDQVYYFRSDQKYVVMRWKEGELLLDEPLKKLGEEFAGQFMRIHRNALVAMVHVDALEKDAEGKYWLVFRDISERLEVSRRHCSTVKRVIQDFHGKVAC